MRRSVLLLVGVGLAGASACGDSTGVQTPAAAPGPTPGLCASPTSVALTVKNYLSECEVSVGGAPRSSAVAQTFCVAPGRVNLAATALPGFALGATPWHDTDADHGTGDPGTRSAGVPPESATAVTVTGNAACVWVCCPRPDGTGCPTTDQCP
jgi:hypothetical protein